MNNEAETKMKKLLIMTVAYNEEKNIGEVLEGIEKLPFKTFKKSFINNLLKKFDQKCFAERKLYQRNIMLEHA